MTQLILDTKENNFVLPETRRGSYNVIEADLGTNIEMISGRTVKEIRGMAWEISYQYGYFSDMDKDIFIAACKKGVGAPISCSFLVPESNLVLTSDFWVTSFTRPKFMWSSEGRALWGDYTVTLREVRPHD